MKQKNKECLLLLSMVALAAVVLAVVVWLGQ